MRVDLFDFEFPVELIALRPAQPRKSARLLVVAPNGSPELADRRVADLPDQLHAGDVVVLNDTRVIPARLLGTRVRGEAAARVEVLLHKRLAPDRWRAFAKPAKRLSPGDRIVFGEASEGIVCELQRLMATVESKMQDGEIDLAFDFHGAILDEAIERFGLWGGGWMTLARLQRCQPLGTHGIDRVPLTAPAAGRWYLPWRYGRWSWRQAEDR